MKVLGIETATALCAAAFIENGAVRSERSLNAAHVHSEKLMALVDEVLQGSAVESLDAVAVSSGPGSFTGLRIGLSVAKGLAYARSLPLVMVPTLRALAWKTAHDALALEHERILSLIDARRDEVYAACYRRGKGGLEEISGPSARTLAQVHEEVQGEGRVVVVGDGAGKFQQFLNGAEGFRFPEPERRLCSASGIGLLGEEMLRRGEVADTASAEPMYVKEFFTLVKPQQTKVTQ